jgi:hypothetical protein
VFCADGCAKVVPADDEPAHDGQLDAGWLYVAPHVPEAHGLAHDEHGLSEIAQELHGLAHELQGLAQEAHGL